MSIVSWSGSVDWLTITWPMAHMDWLRYLMVEKIARRVGEHVAGKQVERERLRWYGYDGWIVGKVFYGEREDGYCLRATGPAAQVICPIIPYGGASVARIDLAVTLWYDEDDTMVAARAKEQVIQWRDRGGLNARQQIHYIDGCGNGDTLYIGTRGSNLYARIYDKWRQSEDEAYKWAWRWEVEIKNAAADQAYKGLKGRDWSPDAIGATVRSYFDAKGVLCPVPSPGTTPINLFVPRTKSDDERLLGWINNQVRPTAVKFAREGRISDILEALGLSEYWLPPGEKPTTDS